MCNIKQMAVDMSYSSPQLALGILDIDQASAKVSKMPSNLSPLFGMCTFLCLLQYQGSKSDIAI